MTHIHFAGRRLLALAAVLLLAHPVAADSPKPNFIVIFADDLGYGDLGCYGHPSIDTPRLDRMAAEGVRFTDFYAASAVCTPSRAALLTGRYATRSGVTSVLFPDSEGGLPQSEITIARALKNTGYATAMIGKWHLGIHEGSRPLDHGFDRNFGLPYSNDMDRRAGVKSMARILPDPPVDGWNVPLIDQDRVIERPADQTTLTRRYTDEALAFMRASGDKPFFLYLAHTMPHTPLFRSADFEGVSARGVYGDVLAEMDHSTGRILDFLIEENLADNTLVIFVSDNGPWLSEQEQGGSAGLLRDGKGTTWEGGQRVPAIAWMPDTVRPSVVRTQASTLDLFPTLLAMAGLRPPDALQLDGIDISPLLKGRTGVVPEVRVFFYIREKEIYACRIGPWKAHFITRGAFRNPAPKERHDPPLLFHLGRDPSEQFNRAAENPEVVARMIEALASGRESLGL